jgi:DNA-binding beta-propeller fold protein YncE
VRTSALVLLAGALVALLGCSGAAGPGVAVAPQAASYTLVRHWTVLPPTDPVIYALGIGVEPATNRVYVVGGQPGEPEVLVFSNTGTPLRHWGSQGAGNGQFYDPQWLALGPHGDTVYVADGGRTQNTRIEKFTTGGQYVTQWGSMGTGDGQFSVLGGLAVDPSGSFVYAVDTNNNRVEKFTNTGGFVLSWGSQGTTHGKFEYPTGIAVDASGDVYVADAHNYRLQKFTNQGVFLKSRPGFPDTMAGVLEGVTVSPGDHLFVVDGASNLVDKFNTNEHFLTSWAAGNFGIAADSLGRVYTTAGGTVWVYAS